MRRLVPLVFLLALAACDSSGDGIATINSRVTVAYVGSLPDGDIFDSSENVTFPIANTIPGFRDNVIGMAVGETKTFDVAPEDGYGDNPPARIPPNTVLTFEVTLLAVR